MSRMIHGTDVLAVAFLALAQLPLLQVGIHSQEVRPLHSDACLISCQVDVVYPKERPGEDSWVVPCENK